MKTVNRVNKHTMKGFPMAGKGIINNSLVDPNKILPMRYAWARQHYKDGVANNWTPEEDFDAERC